MGHFEDAEDTLKVLKRNRERRNQTSLPISELDAELTLAEAQIATAKATLAVAEQLKKMNESR